MFMVGARSTHRIAIQALKAHAWRNRGVATPRRSIQPQHPSRKGQDANDQNRPDDALAAANRDPRTGRSACRVARRQHRSRIPGHLAATDEDRNGNDREYGNDNDLDAVRTNEIVTRARKRKDQKNAYARLYSPPIQADPEEHQESQRGR